MSDLQKHEALSEAISRLGAEGSAALQQVLGWLWDDAFERGRLAALDEFQDRFCVCMK
jgi:hypothetical protein